MTRILFFILAYAPGAFSKTIAEGVSIGMPYVVEKIVSGLQIPWGFEFLDDERLLVGEKHGQLSVIHLKTKKIQIIGGFPPVVDSGQGGLLDLRRHPDYPKKPWLYATYSHPSDKGAATALVRFQIKGAKVSSLETLLVSKSVTSKSHHFGSRIAFDSSGHVYFSIGDRGVRKNAQNLLSHAGSVLRLNLDGSVPKDNPFFSSKKGLKEIWSYGHRNPQGLVYDKQTQTLWEMEHGPRGGDEINWIQKGKNYGWADVSYGREYALPLAVGVPKKKGTLQPVHYYVPSIAPCGLEIYSGKAFPGWKGNLFSGALKLTHLNRVAIKNRKFVKEERLLEGLGRRIRNIRETPEGALLFSTDRGELLILKPKIPKKEV